LIYKSSSEGQEGTQLDNPRAKSSTVIETYKERTADKQDYTAVCHSHGGNSVGLIQTQESPGIEEGGMT